MLQMLNNQNTALQQQQNQMNFLMQAQSAQLTLLTRRCDEEEARRKADEARRAVSADPFAAASAGGTSAAPTTSPVAPPGVPATASFSSGATSSFGGRAEKYLPSLPLINHGEMRAGRIRELEEFHRFLEVLSSWLALTDDAFVPELRQCLFVPNEIQQVSLPSDTAGRSAKLFYLLQQALAKWDRGLEILRSVSTRQGNAAAGYEGVRELYRQYSVNSRMEAVYIRDEMLKLHTKTGSLRRPLEVVRFLEDEISKGEKKLVRFPDLCLNAADKSAILLQAVSVQAREYLVLHGKTGSWSEMSASLRFYEEQLRMVELPGGGVRGLKGDKGRGKDDAPKDKSKVVCWYCGKAGHYQEDCRQKIADDKKRHPKGDSGKGKDKGDHGKTGREKPDPKGKGKGKDSKGKGKGKGKDKGKKDKRVRAVGEGSVDQEEPEGECLMALREGELIPTGVLRTTTPTPAEHQVRLVGVEQQDAYWLVDSGATSHCMSFSCFEKYDVLRTYDHKPTLSNASNETIEVMKVCDVRVRFGKQVVVLEHCLITNLDFNVLSPFVAWQRGWHTMLTNSPHIYNKKNKKRIRLTVKDRAWYAVATLKDGGDQMELDVVQQKPPAAAQAKSKPEKPEAKPKARSASQKPETSKPNKATKAQLAEERRALESVKSLEYTPFKFLLRSLRTTRLQGSLCQVSETQGSRMKAMSSEVAPREHREMAWLLAVLCLNMFGMLAVCVRVARSVCACKVSGLSFPGGFASRLRGICDSVRGNETRECRCGFKPKVQRKVFRRGGSFWWLLVFLLLVPYGASGSASNGCSNHSVEGVLADYPAKAELSDYSAKGVCAQDTAEGGFRYGERLGNVAFEATSVFSFSEKGSQWESYNGGNLSSCKRWESGSLCSSCFGKAGVFAPAAAQGEASKVGAVKGQLCSEGERGKGQSGRSEKAISRDTLYTGPGYSFRATTRIRRTRATYEKSLWSVSDSACRGERTSPRSVALSQRSCCVGSGRIWFTGNGEPHRERLLGYHRVTEWWRNRVRGATSIEEINRLQVNFRKLKQLEEESAVIVSSGSEEEWEQDSAARVEYFRGKVLRMFDEASRVATSSGVGSEEHGESSSPTVDVLVNPTSEYVGYWSPATTSEPTPGAEMAPQTPSPPGVIAPGAEFIPETPPPSGMMASGATGSLAAKAVLEKAAAKALLESLVREQERQDREQERQQLEGPPKGPPKFPPTFLAPTPKVRSIASKTSDPKPSRKASVPKPSKKAGTPEPVPAATSAPEPEPVQPKRRLPPPRAV